MKTIYFDRYENNDRNPGTTIRFMGNDRMVLIYFNEVTQSWWNTVEGDQFLSHEAALNSALNLLRLNDYQLIDAERAEKLGSIA